MLPEAGTREQFLDAVVDMLCVYGVYDAVDACWVGNERGPLLYTTKLFAQAAATIVNMRMKTHGRYLARFCWDDFVMYKGSVDFRVSALHPSIVDRI